MLAFAKMEQMRHLEGKEIETERVAEPDHGIFDIALSTQPDRRGVEYHIGRLAGKAFDDFKDSMAVR